MANYKETEATGSMWLRCKRITITNPYDTSYGPSDFMTGKKEGALAAFNEEQAITIAGHTSLIEKDTLLKFFNPTDTFPILNPITGAPTGNSMTHAELYAVLFSLYLATAAERDAREAAV